MENRRYASSVPVSGINVWIYTSGKHSDLLGGDGGGGGLMMQYALHHPDTLGECVMVRLIRVVS